MAKVDPSFMKSGKKKPHPSVVAKASKKLKNKKRGAPKPTDDKRADVAPAKRTAREEERAKKKRIPIPVASGGSKKVKAPSTLKDLKAANYNPREITDRQLTQLEGSVKKFGDLSGITFNVASGVLVTGHQRVKVTSALPSRIVRQPQKRDGQGTVAVGFVEVKKPDGNVIKIPYREVDWDVNTEMAANVAANAAGGDFDMVKLGKVMKRLDEGSFAIEEVPIDPWTLNKSIVLFESSAKKAAEGKASGEFEKVDPKALAGNLKHCCPKCGFKWG